ncbi:MAG: hypothetical protein ACFCD0_04775 [Gemmataceae bacterium]
MSLPKPGRDYADQTIRTTLQHPENLWAVLEHTVPQFASQFDVEEARLLARGTRRSSSLGLRGYLGCTR